MTHTNELIINLNSIKSNLIALREKAAGAKFYAVVKADAYGLGAIKISEAIEDMVDGFCVSSMTEAVELRRAGIKKDILLLGYLNPNEYGLVSDYKISITIYNYQIAKQIDDFLKRSSAKATIHIKIDTGHGRLGFLPSSQALDEIEAISQLDSFSIGGIFSHFATADEKNEDFCNLQMQRFMTVVEDLEKRGLALGDRHISNDAGFIKHGFSLDMVRSGIGLYGIYPSSLLAEEKQVNLKASFEWISTISNIKTIDQGDSLSYGRTFIAKRPMKIATISIGYADGYKRLISNRGYVLIKGKKAFVVGNIAMDQMMVDISGIDAKIGDRVTLIGENGGEVISLDQMAQWCQTISYEIMTSISKRVSRIYVN